MDYSYRSIYNLHSKPMAK